MIDESWEHTFNENSKISKGKKDKTEKYRKVHKSLEGRRVNKSLRSNKIGNFINKYFLENHEKNN